MRKMLRCAVWIVPLIFFCTLNCSTPMSAGGSSSETVIGKVVNSNGSPACSTVVTLFPADYDPIRDSANTQLMSDTTDAAGAYCIRTFGLTQHYSIVATQQKSGTRALVSGIIPKGDTTRLQVVVLSMPGTIIAVAPDTVNSSKGYLYIPGTGIAAFLNGSHRGLLNQVPAGTIVSINYVSGSSTGASGILASGIEVVSNDTTVLPYPQWRYSKRLYLNTAASGAGVLGNVVNFPVLVRLTAANFDFSLAKSDGSDIRFTKSNGTLLSFEIERWDAGARRAEIWVRTDTVYGNNSNQYLMMLWGNGNAVAQSNGPAVFDTAKGIQGVWHLAGAENAIAKDATGNHYDGMPSDTAPTGSEGLIGPCRLFNGISNFIRMNGTSASKLNFQENGIYTISAWAYADTLDNGFHLIAGKSNEQYFLKLKQTSPPNSMRWEFVEYQDKTGWNITNGIPSAKTWAYVVGVRKGTSQYFYLNGQLVNNTITITSASASRHTGDDVTIGKFLSMPSDTIEGKCAFLGKIDEVRILSVASGADWIKLCYMNQKEQDALISW